MGWGDSEGCAPVGHRQGDMGVGVNATPPSNLERALAAWQDAYDALWHRCRHHAPHLTTNLPSPHQLRTGETPTDLMEGLRQGVHLHEQGGASS